MAEKVVIFGTTEMAMMCHLFFTHDSPYEVAGFTSERDFIKEATCCSLPVVPFEDIERVYPPDEFRMFVAMFYGKVNKNRSEKYQQAKDKGYQLINYISSKATIWPGIKIGDNCLISDNVIIHPFSEIGNNNVLGPACFLSHHVIVKDHCYLCPHAAILGGVTIEPYCFIGTNATIRDDVTISQGCVIGAGALILHNTEEGQVYKGRGAELLSRQSHELHPGLK